LQFVNNIIRIDRKKQLLLNKNSLLTRIQTDFVMEIRKSKKFGSYNLGGSSVTTAVNVISENTSSQSLSLPANTSSNMTIDGISPEVGSLIESITDVGNRIRDIKATKSPTAGEEIKPLVAQLLELKSKYKELTGEEFGKKVSDDKIEKQTPATEKSTGLSKTELKKQKQKEEKAAKKAAANADKPSANTQQQEVVDESLLALFGDYPIVQSTFMTEKFYVNVRNLSESLVGQHVWIRGRLHTSRAVGKGIFLVLRQNISTVQAVMFQGSKIPKAMVKYAAGIPLESIVDIYAFVTKPEIPVQSVTIKSVELLISEIHTVSRALELPFIVDDAGRNEAEAVANNLPIINQDTALNYRWIDTRTPANQAIFRIQAGVCQLFREFLTSKDFVEIHTPKLIGGASEGGSNVFTFKYFETPACLAQSPQLYKQMASACGGFERVFEIGPVFRAENSNTNRHLCEFTGLDFEMAILEHYYEALEV
jgi:aspartyl-tRNA synthetase